MNNMRYLIMLVMCLIWHITAFGQSDFNPVSPQEPDKPQIKHKLTLLVLPNDGGSVSGGGSYVDGSLVTVRATASSGYSFEAWSDKNGMVLATASPFQYTTQEKNDTLYAHFRFTPSSPSDPAEPSSTLYYHLMVEPDQGCSVSGGGRYLAGKSISVSASLENGYEFVNWTNANGDVVSTARSFSYTKQAENEVLTAHCRFNPSVPTEPGNPILKHWIRASCTDGGTIGGSTNSRILEGDKFSLNATANTGYEFMGWYLNGDLYTMLTSFNYTMGKEDLNFEARFRFNPLPPTEPPMAALNMYTYYLMTVNGKPGDVINYPINLVNTAVVHDMNIRLMFPVGMEVDPENYLLSNLAQDYDVAIAEAMDTISIIEEGVKLWDFTLIGGETLPATQALLTFKVKIPDNCPTGLKHQVKINQISMTMEDGTAVTARTRNGRIGVYRNGDVNGDDNVNITDVLGTLSIMKQVEDETLIREVADPNADGDVNISDVLGILEIMKENSNEE